MIPATAYTDDDEIVRKILANPAYKIAGLASSNNTNFSRRHKFSLRASLPLPHLPLSFRDELLPRAQYVVTDMLLFADVKVAITKCERLFVLLKQLLMSRQ